MPQIRIQNDKPVSVELNLLPLGQPFLERLRCVRTVDILFKTSAEDEKKIRKVTKKKDKWKNGVNDKNRKNRKIRRKRKKRNWGRSKRNETNDKEDRDDRIGWQYDEQTKKVVYCDKFHDDFRWHIRGLETMHVKKKEFSICKKFKIRPCFVKLRRIEFYKCRICNLTYKSKADRRSHEHIHQEKTFRCMRCGRDFAMLKYLKQHENFHGSKKQFKCQICEKKYFYRSGLSKHIKIEHAHLPSRIARLKMEHKKKPLFSSETSGMQQEKTARYKCNQCGRIFKRGIAFANHNRGHTRTMNLKCTYCQERFKTQYQRSLHINRCHASSSEIDD